MPLAREPTTDGAILYDPALIAAPTAADFEPQQLAASGRLCGQASGRGATLFIVARGATDDRWALRHFRRGGLMARVTADRYLWAGEAATRGFAEARLLARLVARALPVPVPVAARYARSGWSYRADLITVLIPGTHTLSALCTRDEPLDDRRAGSIGRAAGQAIRRLHDAGVWHADLNAHNVLVDAGGRAWIIDFDRARERPPGAWAADNLARLRRSLEKLHAARGRPLDAALWSAILAGYGV